MGSIPTPNEDSIRSERPEDLRSVWPEAIAAMHDALAEGLALMVPTRLNGPDGPGRERSQEALNRLSHDADFRKAMLRLVGRFARSAPETDIDSDGDIAVVSTEGAWRWADELVAETAEFARQRRFPYLRQEDVALVLFQAVTHSLRSGYSGQIRFRGSTPLVHVNPYDDRPATIFLSPRSVVVDLTCATAEDLEDLKSVLPEIQERLGYRSPVGRRSNQDEALMQFAHELRTKRTGRNAVRDWETVTTLVNKRFEADLEASALRQRYSVWKRTRLFTIVDGS